MPSLYFSMQLRKCVHLHFVASIHEVIESLAFRSYGPSSDTPVHENPEWEKARQALASIKSPSSTKNSQAGAQVCWPWPLEALCSLGFSRKPLAVHRSFL